MRTILRALLLAVLVCLPGCPGVGLGFQVEKDGRSYGAECHRNTDGTWSCNIEAHLDGESEHEETP